MKTVCPQISVNLDAADCEAVVAGALSLLADPGVECASSAGRALMTECPGVRERGNRLRFDPDFLRSYLGELRQAAAGYARPERFRLRPPWVSLNIADVRSGQVRLATEADLARAVRLYEALDIRGGMPPVTVGTAPPERQGLLNTLVCLENSESFGHPTEVPVEEELGPFLDMFAAVGRQPTVMALFMISPLRMESRLVEFCLRHRDDGRLDIAYGVGDMPCVGSTAPLAFPAAFCQTLAECLAGSVFAWRCTGRKLDFGLRLNPFDFLFGNYVVGSAESALLDMVSRRLFEHLFGRPWYSGRLLTMARWPDAQAIHDHALSAYVQALQGVRTFRGSGQIAHDMVFSPEIVVIDRDIIGAAERFMRGLDWQSGAAAGAAGDAVRAGLEAGNFLEQEATLEGFREFQFTGELFKGISLGQWRQAGARPLIEEAAEAVDRLAAGREFRRPEAQLRELRAIYRRAVGE